MRHCDYCTKAIRRTGKKIVLPERYYGHEYTVCSRKCEDELRRLNKNPGSADPKPSDWGMVRPLCGLGNRGY